MKHIVTLKKGELNKTEQQMGCGECAVSCQSACKTSCTIANQKCARNAK